MRITRSSIVRRSPPWVATGLAALSGILAPACGANQATTAGDAGFETVTENLTYTATTDAGLQYVYDAVGRLVGVIVPTGAAAQYDYDAAGNITKITSISATTLSVVGFSPSVATSGSTMTIYGSGFSTTLANNTVKINGVACTVTSATGNILTVTIPAGVTAGTVTVKVGTTTKTSHDAVTVPPTAVPTITGISPDAGLPDASITITGTNFDSAQINDKAWLNGGSIRITSASSTTIVGVVPGGVVSGHASVATPVGTATGASDFFVPYPGYTLNQIAATGRLAYDAGSLSMSFDAGLSGLIVFDTQQGDSVCIWVSGVSSVPAGYGPTVGVLDRTGTKMTETIISADTAFNILDLKGTGSSEVALLSPGATWVNATVRVFRAGVLQPSQASTFSTPVAALEGLYTFDANAGDAFSLLLSGCTFPSGVTVSVLDPNGNNIGTGSGGSTSSVIDIAAFSQSGKYSVTLVPSAAEAGQITLTLLRDDTGTLTLDGGVKASSLVAGQLGDYTFNANAGDNLSLLLSGCTFPSGATVTVNDPNGTQIGYASSASGSGVVDLNGLALSGTYGVFLVPSAAEAGVMDLTLLKDDSGQIATDGGIKTISLVAGQRGDYSFDTTTGEWLGLGVPTFSTTPAGQYVFFTMSDDGGAYSYEVSATTATSFDLLQLFDGGTYTVRVEPLSSQCTALTIGLDLIQPQTGTVTVGGAAAVFSTSVVGQDAMYTFSGTVGNNRTVSVSGNTFASGVTVTVYDPTFSSIASQSFTDGGSLSLVSLPATGTYTVSVDPNLACIGQESVKVQ